MLEGILEKVAKDFCEARNVDVSRDWGLTTLSTPLDKRRGYLNQNIPPTYKKIIPHRIKDVAASIDEGILPHVIYECCNY